MDGRGGAAHPTSTTAGGALTPHCMLMHGAARLCPVDAVYGFALQV